MQVKDNLQFFFSFLGFMVFCAAGAVVVYMLGAMLATFIVEPFWHYLLRFN